MISIDQRLHREDVLFRLLGALPGAEFAADPACHAEPDVPVEQREALAELFWPVSEQDTDRIEQAKAVCQRCPVQGSCLQFALNHGENEGIWGGLTPAERRRLRIARDEDALAEAEIAHLNPDDDGDVQDGPGEVAA